MQNVFRKGFHLTVKSVQYFGVFFQTHLKDNKQTTPRKAEHIWQISKVLKLSNTLKLFIKRMQENLVHFVNGKIETTIGFSWRIL